MSNQPDFAPLQQYSKKYAKELCDTFFREYDYIKGEQLVALAGVHQVNLLVVKVIFQQWQQETTKLQSPYFDYAQKDVQEALNVFMNVLSKNISIERKDFEPILEQATEETLLLLFYPAIFYERLFMSFEQKIHIEKDLKPLFKYVRLHQELKNALWEALEQSSTKVKRREAVGIARQIVKSLQEEFDSPSETLQAFDQTLPTGLYELAPDWGFMQVEEMEDEDGLEEPGFDFSEDSSAFQEDTETNRLAQEVNEELQEEMHSQGFMDELKEDDDDGDDVDEELFIADHLKTNLDPVNDNVFISNQEEIYNEGLVTETDFANDDEETHAEDEDIFAEATKDLSELTYASNTYEDPYVFEEPTEVEEKTEEEPDFFHADENDAKEDGSLENSSIEIEESPAVQQASLPQERIPSFEPTPQETPESQQRESIFERQGTPQLEEDKKSESEKPLTLHEKLAREKQEQKSEEATTVLDKLKAKQFKELKGTVPLHLKFKFQNELFGGDSDTFNEAIELVDKAPSYHDALALIKSRYVLNFDWDFSNETTLEFISMVEDKYDD